MAVTLTPFKNTVTGRAGDLYQRQYEVNLEAELSLLT